MIPKMTDKKGRDWFIVIDIGVARKILSSFRIDFANSHDPKSGLDRLQNYNTLSDVLCVFVEEQLAAQNVSKDDFFSSCDGPALASGFEAIMEALVLFTPPAMKPAMEAILVASREHDKAKAMRIVETFQGDAIQQTLARNLNQLESQIVKGMEKSLLTSTTGSESTNTKLSSESR